MASRRLTLANQAARIRHVITLDARRVLRRLADHQDEMVALFSRLRSRQPLLEPIATWFSTVTLTELATLEPREQKAVALFYEVLDETRWYLAYTEDMPGQVQLKLTQLVRRLDTAHRALTAAIGAPEDEGAPVVDAVVNPKRSRRPRR